MGQSQGQADFAGDLGEMRLASSPVLLEQPASGHVAQVRSSKKGFFDIAPDLTLNNFIAASPRQS